MAGRVALLLFLAWMSWTRPGGIAWCGLQGHPGTTDVPVHGYELVNTFPHDLNASTQGLICRDGFLFEGTGLYGQSSLRKVRIETGEVLKIHHLAPDLFGEGITSYNDAIFQLTWRNHVGFVYLELDTFALIERFTYPYVGWGLTHDDTSLILSDGTSRLYHLNPQTFETVGQIEVTADGFPLDELNELEYVQGKIFANILGSAYVAVIDPKTGVVLGWIDLSDLHTPRGPHNGIAYDPETFRLFVTGKKWANLYEIRVDPIDYPPEIASSSPDAQVWLGRADSVTLSIQCQDPDPEDTLRYAWSVDGAIDTSAHHTSYTYVSRSFGIDTVVAWVCDGKFSDSTSWIVNVIAPKISDNRPNPFTTETAIRFASPGGDRVRLRVYDLAGRLVATLIDGGVSPGTQEATWDGTNSSGRRVAPGLYFAHVEARGLYDTRMMVMIR